MRKERKAILFLIDVVLIIILLATSLVKDPTVFSAKHVVSKATDMDNMIAQICGFLSAVGVIGLFVILTIKNKQETPHES